MRLPAICGTIDRRILVNYRVDPSVLSRVLPAPFRPQTVDGSGIAGICLIRLKSIRPRTFPRGVGLSSENAAHRIAVEWDDGGQTRTGVFVPRRDTSSILNVMAGGRLFPGVHHRARFDVVERDGRFRVEMNSLDGSAHVLVDGSLAAGLAPGSAFPGIEEASRFFEAGSLGYSPDAKQGRYEGLELRSFHWHVQPLAIDAVKSSFFDDRNVFPVGSVTFDSALLMRGIEHEWHGREPLPFAPERR